MTRPPFRASRLTRATLTLALPLVAVAFIASACGGATAKASASSSSPTTSAPANTGAASRAKYTSCLEGKGVPASVAGAGFFGGRRGAGSSGTPGTGSPGTGTRPTIPSQYQAAIQSCRSLLPVGRFGGGGLNSAAFTAYRNCLQVHGVTLPSTPATTTGGSGGTGGFGSGGFGSLANNPAYASARQACASLLPSGAGRPATTVPAAA